jgi:hypothetical protein
VVLCGVVDECEGLFWRKMVSCLAWVSLGGVVLVMGVMLRHTVVMEIQAGRRSRGSEDAPER